MAGKKKPPRPLGHSPRRTPQGGPAPPESKVSEQIRQSTPQPTPQATPRPTRHQEPSRPAPPIAEERLRRRMEAALAAPKPDAPLRRRMEEALAARAAAASDPDNADSPDLRTWLLTALEPEPDEPQPDEPANDEPADDEPADEGPADDVRQAAPPPTPAPAPRPTPAPAPARAPARAPTPKPAPAPAPAPRPALTRRPTPTPTRTPTPPPTPPVRAAPAAASSAQPAQPAQSSPSSRTRVALLVAALLVIGVNGVVLIRSLGSEPEPASRLSSVNARPTAPVPVRAGSSYVETTVRPDGTISVSHWVRPRVQATEVSLSLPEVPTGQTLRATDLRVEVDGSRVPGPRSIERQPHTFVFAGGREIFVRYVLTGALERSSSADGRALVRVASLDLAVRDVETRTQAVSGVDVLSLACTSIPEQGAVPEPCGEDVGDGWAVRLTGSEEDDQVMAQIDLG